MAGYTITCSCGHTTTKQLYGPGKERQRYIEWMERSGLCPECYKEQRREKEKEMGLVARVRIDYVRQFSDRQDEMTMAVVFDGDTYPHKDAIKAAGAFWTDEYPGGNAIESLISSRPQPKRWCIWFDLRDAEETLDKVLELGAEIVEMPQEMDAAMAASIRKSACRAKDKQFNAGE